jgi:hypothetical protein
VLVSKRLICWSMLLSRPMRDRRAVARYAGLTGSPDESGARRREQGLGRAGNARGESAANRNWPAGTFRSSAEAGPGAIPHRGTERRYGAGDETSYQGVKR